MFTTDKKPLAIDKKRPFSSLLSLNIYTPFSSSRSRLSPSAVCLLLLSSAVRPCLRRRPWRFLAACLPCLLCLLSSGGCRHSSAIRRKTLWQCGQMHSVNVPGRASSRPDAATCSVARSAACSVRPACCRVSSGGNNSLYASISRAAAIRCSVCNVILLLSIAVYTVCLCIPIRRDNSTMPIPAAFICSLI